MKYLIHTRQYIQQFQMLFFKPILCMGKHFFKCSLILKMSEEETGGAILADIVFHISFSIFQRVKKVHSAKGIISFSSSYLGRFFVFMYKDYLISIFERILFLKIVVENEL